MKPTVPAVFTLIVLAATTVGLTGCGQKSELYLPGHNPNPPEPLMPAAGPDKNPGDRAQKDGQTDGRRSDSPSTPPDMS